ncbi:MAG: hypothetical protein QOF94_3145 [Acidobacteriaceae bacterium]
MNCTDSTESDAALTELNAKYHALEEAQPADLRYVVLFKSNLWET